MHTLQSYIRLWNVIKRYDAYTFVIPEELATVKLGDYPHSQRGF